MVFCFNSLFLTNMTWLELDSSSIIMDISNNLDHFKLFYIIYYVVSLYLLYLIKFSAFTHNMVE